MTEKGLDDIFDVTKESAHDLIPDDLMLLTLGKIKSLRTIGRELIKGKEVVNVNRNDQLLLVMTHLYGVGGFRLYWDDTPEGKSYFITTLRFQLGDKVYTKRFKAASPSGSASIGVTE